MAYYCAKTRKIILDPFGQKTPFLVERAQNFTQKSYLRNTLIKI